MSATFLNSTKEIIFEFLQEMDKAHDGLQKIRGPERHKQEWRRDLWERMRYSKLAGIQQALSIMRYRAAVETLLKYREPASTLYQVKEPNVWAHVGRFDSFEKRVDDHDNREIVDQITRAFVTAEERFPEPFRGLLKREASYDGNFFYIPLGETRIKRNEYTNDLETKDIILYGAKYIAVDEPFWDRVVMPVITKGEFVPCMPHEVFVGSAYGLSSKDTNFLITTIRYYYSYQRNEPLHCYDDGNRSFEVRRSPSQRDSTSIIDLPTFNRTKLKAGDAFVGKYCFGYVSNEPYIEYIYGNRKHSIKQSIITNEFTSDGKDKVTGVCNGPANWLKISADLMNKPSFDYVRKDESLQGACERLARGIVAPHLQLNNGAFTPGFETSSDKPYYPNPVDASFNRSN